MSKIKNFIAYFKELQKEYPPVIFAVIIDLYLIIILIKAFVDHYRGHS